MQRFIDQATHNQRFHESIEGSFPNQFYDWRITVLFYVANHYLKALAAKRNKNIGRTHSEISRNVDPNRHGGNMPITRTAWQNYRDLFQYSCNARYEGIEDDGVFEELMKDDHIHCQKHLSDFKKYIEGQGVPI